jgi:nicotinic acid mononucleotide adenylyltransferase
MRLRELFEAPETTAVMAFGRMNPPTIGHAKLVDAVVSQGGDPYIFLSQSQKPKTDPLAFEDKLRYAKFFFPNVTIGNPEVKTIIQALQKVAALGYANLIYVAGSDRVASFEKLLNDYNGKEYNFNSIKVVSAGERDPDADGAEGMSASKMRAAAAEGDLESFKQGVPQQEVADEMYAAVRQGMGIRDEQPVEESNPFTDARMNAIKAGKDTFTVGSKTYKVTGDTSDEENAVDEVAPPGREKQVKALKKKFDNPGAPYAIAWAQHNKKKSS